MTQRHLLMSNTIEFPYYSFPIGMDIEMRITFWVKPDRLVLGLHARDYQVGQRCRNIEFQFNLGAIAVSNPCEQDSI